MKKEHIHYMSVCIIKYTFKKVIDNPTMSQETDTLETLVSQIEINKGRGREDSCDGSCTPDSSSSREVRYHKKWDN